MKMNKKVINIILVFFFWWILGFGFGYLSNDNEPREIERISTDTIYQTVISEIEKPVYLTSKPRIIRDTVLVKEYLKSQFPDEFCKIDSVEFPYQIAGKDLYLANRFTAIDTLLNKSDTIINSFLFPELEFRYKIINAPDTTMQRTIIKNVEAEKAFYDETYFHLMMYPLVIIATLYATNK